MTQPILPQIRPSNTPELSNRRRHQGFAPVAPADDRPSLLQGQDTYNRQGRQPAPPVIDAEFVEFYSPSIQSLQQERQTLDLSLDPEDHLGTNSVGGNETALPPALASYRSSSKDIPPPPGSIINILA